MSAADRYAYRRERMVEALRHAGIRDERVLEAMGGVPRHLFVPDAYRHQAYETDVSINIGSGQTISQPLVVARMSEAARLGAEDRVLEVGTGSGYQAAVLSRLVRCVFSVERIPSLAREAKGRLDRLGVENVSVKVMDGTLGWSGQAPYGAILVTAGAPELPELLFRQLADRGRLVIPLGPIKQQVLTVVERRGDERVVRQLTTACFVPLVGRHGWSEER
jgi:protein-L-isoaspartate(D-aspartate) O-methyltransferase